MRAAVLHSIEDDKFDIRDDVEAVGPGPGQVRIRVRAAGVCHSDLSARNGGLPQPVPAILGHEAAGDVVAVGDGVTDLAVGDRVIANWLPPCGSCPSCLRGEPYLCMTHVIAAYVEPRFLVGDTPAFGMAGCGAFAEEMVVPQAGAVKIDADVPYEVAALVGCGVMTGVGAVINTAPGRARRDGRGDRLRRRRHRRDPGRPPVRRRGHRGGRHRGGQARGGPRLRRHPRRPPGRTWPSCRPSSPAARASTTPSRWWAAPQTIRAAWTAARRGGTVVVVGAGRADQQVEFTPFELLFDGKKMLPSLYGSAESQRDFPRLLGLWRTGRLDLEGMITQRLRLDDIDEALAALGRGDVIRQVVIHG